LGRYEGTMMRLSALTLFHVLGLCLASACEDDPNFEFEPGIPFIRYDCYAHGLWATAACLHPEVQDSCPQMCGRCQCACAEACTLEDNELPWCYLADNCLPPADARRDGPFGLVGRLWTEAQCKSQAVDLLSEGDSIDFALTAEVQGAAKFLGVAGAGITIKGAIQSNVMRMAGDGYTITVSGGVNIGVMAEVSATPLQFTEGEVEVTPGVKGSFALFASLPSGVWEALDQLRRGTIPPQFQVLSVTLQAGVDLRASIEAGMPDVISAFLDAGIKGDLGVEPAIAATITFHPDPGMSFSVRGRTHVELDAAAIVQSLTNNLGGVVEVKGSAPLPSAGANLSALFHGAARALAVSCSLTVEDELVLGAGPTSPTAGIYSGFEVAAEAAPLRFVSAAASLLTSDWDGGFLRLASESSSMSLALLTEVLGGISFSAKDLEVLGFGLEGFTAEALLRRPMVDRALTLAAGDDVGDVLAELRRFFLGFRRLQALRHV